MNSTRDLESLLELSMNSNFKKFKARHRLDLSCWEISEGMALDILIYNLVLQFVLSFCGNVVESISRTLFGQNKTDQICRSFAYSHGRRDASIRVFGSRLMQTVETFLDCHTQIDSGTQRASFFRNARAPRACDISRSASIAASASSPPLHISFSRRNRIISCKK